MAQFEGNWECRFVEEVPLDSGKPHQVAFVAKRVGGGPASNINFGFGNAQSGDAFSVGQRRTVEVGEEFVIVLPFGAYPERDRIVISEGDEFDPNDLPTYFLPS